MKTEGPSAEISQTPGSLNQYLHSAINETGAEHTLELDISVLVNSAQPPVNDHIARLISASRRIIGEDRIIETVAIECMPSLSILEIKTSTLSTDPNTPSSETYYIYQQSGAGVSLVSSSGKVSQISDTDPIASIVDSMKGIALLTPRSSAGVRIDQETEGDRHLGQTAQPERQVPFTTVQHQAVGLTPQAESPGRNQQRFTEPSPPRPPERLAEPLSARFANFAHDAVKRMTEMIAQQKTTVTAVDAWLKRAQKIPEVRHFFDGLVDDTYSLITGNYANSGSEPQAARNILVYPLARLMLSVQEMRGIGAARILAEAVPADSPLARVIDKKVQQIVNPKDTDATTRKTQIVASIEKVLSEPETSSIESTLRYVLQTIHKVLTGTASKEDRDAFRGLVLAYPLFERAILKNPDQLALSRLIFEGALVGAVGPAAVGYTVAIFRELYRENPAVDS